MPLEFFLSVKKKKETSTCHASSVYPAIMDTSYNE